MLSLPGQHLPLTGRPRAARKTLCGKQGQSLLPERNHHFLKIFIVGSSIPRLVDALTKLRKKKNRRLNAGEEKPTSAVNRRRRKEKENEHA